MFLRPCSLAIATLVSGIATFDAWAGPTVLTTCGPTYERHLVLTGDLDCSGTENHAVDMRRGGHLDLNGHTIRNATLFGVQCGGPCTIQGPGGIVDGAGIAVRAARLRLRNVTISDNGGLAVDATNNFGTGRVRISGSTIEGNGGGVFAESRVMLEDTTVTGNGLFGVAVTHHDGCRSSQRVKLKNSTVSGNSTGAGCGTNVDCMDIESCPLPALDETSSCGTSTNAATGQPWGVCTLD